MGWIGRTLRLLAVQEMGLVAVVLLLGAGLTVFGGNITDLEGRTVNNFLRLPNLLGILSPMSLFAIMALGVSIVIIAGGIDISVATMFALSALGTVAVVQHLPADSSGWIVIPTALAVACAIGTACGLLNGALVVGLRIHPFVVTLGTMSMFRGICNVAVPTKTLPDRTLGLKVPDALTFDFMQYQPVRGLLPVPIAIMLIVVLAAWFYLRFTVAGRETYAVGGNEEAARYSGLAVGRIKVRVYGLCGLAAGIAGFVYAGYYGSASSDTGQGWELIVIAAAVVGGASLAGGRGTALGALLGTLVIKLIENGIFIMRYDQQYSTIIVGAAIIVAVSVDRLAEYARGRRLAASAQ
mgnify:FL=1